MKKITLITLFLTITTMVNAQIKNAGFENWSNLNPHVYEGEMVDSHYVQNPTHGDIENWTYDYYVGVSQTTDAYAGSYAAILHNWYNYGKTTLVYRDTISVYPGELLGYYKYISDPFTSGTINVVVKSNQGDTIINSDWYLGPQLNWSPFTHTLTPLGFTTDPADSIIISITNSPFNCQGNYMTCNLLYLDDFSLTQGIAGVEQPTMIDFGMFPNPATDVITIQLSNAIDNGDVSITLMDMMGNAVRKQQLSGLQGDLNIQHLAPGAYIVQLETEAGSIRRQPLAIH